jgi:hypothetical protein
LGFFPRIPHFKSKSSIWTGKPELFSKAIFPRAGQAISLDTQLPFSYIQPTLKRVLVITRSFVAVFPQQDFMPDYDVVVIGAEN